MVIKQKRKKKVGIKKKKKDQDLRVLLSEHTKSEKLTMASLKDFRKV